MRVLLLLCLLCGLAAAGPSRSASGYRHGKRFKIKIVDVEGSELEVNTARAYVKMRDAARADGIGLYVMSGFRTYEYQAALYARYRARAGHLAARPGHSNHQSGSALDLVIDDEQTYAWLTAHARRFGFRRTVRGEPWHWELVKAPRERYARTSQR
jgi:zinc D-Ala-D-Ala carboxypeptidase